jgi:WD repeat-containing protein 48
VLHNGPISESSIHGVAEDRKRELTKPNTWHWKIVDTDLEPSSDDPPDNGGRTIAFSVWSMHNLKAEAEGSNEASSIPAEKTDDTPGFLPPELRLDALTSLFTPIEAARKSVMGTSTPFFMLNQLGTHPDHQGRGAASLMLNWGLNKADKEGLVTYLVATVPGRPVYEKRGFELVSALEWDRVPWGGEGKDWHGFMVRQPQTAG